MYTHDVCVRWLRLLTVYPGPWVNELDRTRNLARVLRGTCDCEYISTWMYCHEPTCGLFGSHIVAGGDKYPTGRLLGLLIGGVVDLTIAADGTKWLAMRLLERLSESFLANVRAKGGHLDTVCLNA